MQTLWQDLRYGVRTMRTKPGFTLVAVITLALGIGANTAIFSTVDALLLRPLAFQDMGRLVLAWNSVPQGGDRNPVSPADFVDWRHQQQVFSHLAAYRLWDVNLTAVGEPERVVGARVSADFFQALSVKAAQGRTFLPEEDQPGRERVVIISQSLWERRWAADPQIVGRTITLDGRSHTVVGVIPADYEWPLGAEAWAPLALTSEELKEREQRSLQVLGRLKPKVSFNQAQAEIEIIARRLEQQYPHTNARHGIKLVHLPGGPDEFDIRRQILLIVMVAAGFVLLIACANVANLQLARATGRQREIAIRTALGASRFRVVQQLLTESLLLASLGGVLGLLLALWGIDLLKANIPPNLVKFIPGATQIGLNFRSLGFTLVIALLTGTLAGLAPAVQASKPNLNEALKEGGQSTTAGLGRSRLRHLLVVGEIALALILLVGTGLMVKGSRHVANDHRQGFDPAHVLTLRLTLPASKYREPHQQVAFYQQVLERIAELPGVQSAGAVSSLPSSFAWRTESFGIEGRPAPTPADAPLATLQSVGANYFEAMRIPLRAGRGFAAQDGETAPTVALISESLQRRYWPNEDPTGRKIKLNAAPQRWLTVVGVVGDVRNFALDLVPQQTIYLPYEQAPGATMSLVVRTGADPLSLAAAVRAAVRDVDPHQPLYDIKPMEQVLSEPLAGIRIAAGMMAIFGALALLLAAVGIYGVMSYAVTQRTHEIGIRMALGADAGNVLRLVMQQALRLAALGLGLGLPLAFGLSRVMASLLTGVIALEPVTFIGFAMLLAVVALLSGYLPARRAARVDPMVALRYE